MQNFYIEYPTIDFILIAIFIITPIILIVLKRKIFKNFNYSGFLKILNRNLFIQIALGILVFVIGIIADGYYFGRPRSELNEITVETGLLYPMILIMIYIPCTLVLNVITVLAKKSI